jgi:hypothetical protein
MLSRPRSSVCRPHDRSPIKQLQQKTDHLPDALENAAIAQRTEEVARGFQRSREDRL